MTGELPNYHETPHQTTTINSHYLRHAQKHPRKLKLQNDRVESWLAKKRKKEDLTRNRRGSDALSFSKRAIVQRENEPGRKISHPGSSSTRIASASVAFVRIFVLECSDLRSELDSALPSTSFFFMAFRLIVHKRPRTVNDSIVKSRVT